MFFCCTHFYLHFLYFFISLESFPRFMIFPFNFFLLSPAFLVILDPFKASLTSLSFFTGYSYTCSRIFSIRKNDFHDQRLIQLRSSSHSRDNCIFRKWKIRTKCGKMFVILVSCWQCFLKWTRDWDIKIREFISQMREKIVSTTLRKLSTRLEKGKWRPRQ